MTLFSNSLSISSANAERLLLARRLSSASIAVIKNFLIIHLITMFSYASIHRHADNVNAEFFTYGLPERTDSSTTIISLQRANI